MLKAGTAVASGVVSFGAVGASLVAGSRTLRERQMPLIGLVAAFVLVLQAIHIPLGPGMTAHLLGGALAAILLGPWLGLLVLAAVVLVETVGFGHGGVAALGANILLTGLIGGVGGYWLFRGLLLILPRTRTGLLTASAISAWTTVVLASAGGVAMLTFGGVLGPGLARPFIGLTILAHGVTGIAEAVVTAAAVGAVASARPDLTAIPTLVPMDRPVQATPVDRL